jgi:preprotein translocase subunit Sec61beta
MRVYEIDPKCVMGYTIAIAILLIIEGIVYARVYR